MPINALSLFLLLAASALASPKEKEREEVIILVDNHRVTIAVPAGFVYTSGREPSGFLMAKVANAKETVTLQVQFQPDPEGRLATEQHQMDFLAEVCRQYAEGSVEKGYDFKALAPRVGTGTYCTFTDASLNRDAVPKGEFLNVTQGVKVWSGWALVFTLLSNDTTSNDYLTALRLMKETFQEKPAPGPKI